VMKKDGIIRQPVMRRPEEPNTGTLLLYAYKSFDRELFASLHQAGHRGLRSRHGAVLANLDERGTRLTTLARRGGIGTSAMGEIVDELERLGYVERMPDPKDRRAKLVIPTTAGASAIDLAFRTIREIEARYARLLGQSGHVALREALTRLAGTPGGPRAEPRAQARDPNGDRAQ
jgi:DNA-binding MarR family transcriptional regulator